MEALLLEFETNLKSKILAVLSTFSPEELKIVDSDLINKPKSKLDNAYQNLKSGEAQFCSIEELEELLDKTFSKYDN